MVDKNIFEAPEFRILNERVKISSNLMRNHRVFGLIRNIEDLREFMSWHVFAVWDFMSLVKRLQIEFTCTTLPWIAPKNFATARLINEIVLAEESDIGPDGTNRSHFDLYLQAMEEVGADTTRIRKFVELITAQLPVDEALHRAEIAPAIQKFVNATIQVATKGSVEEVLGNFVFGREDAIPEMFQSLLQAWHIDQSTAPTFVFYLQRHISLDADEHGPAAMQMIFDKVGTDTAQINSLLIAAQDAIQSRIDLWDEMAIHLERGKIGT